MQKRYPFKFLDAYSKKDTDIFFGRDEEVEALYQMTFQSDILLVYGASGTGKTSLINCGLASRFQAHDWLALNIRRVSNINRSLQQKLDEVTAGITTGATDHDLSWLDDYEEEENATGSEITRQLQEIYRQYFRPVYLIFDQFEELYILGSKTEQAEFIRNVQEIQSVDHPVKMFFVIREEYLGHLFEFERAVPQLLRKKLRVEPMNLDKVGQVVRGAAALGNTNVRLQEGQEDAIVEGIFQKIRGDEQTLAIQLPYLQVFLDKLYLQVTGDEKRQAEAVFTTQALQKIGDIGDVLRDFLEDRAVRIQKTLKQKYPDLPKDAVWQILSPLATLEGTKEPMLEEELLQRLSHLPEAAVREGLQELDRSRILRFDENDCRYEVAHDSLAARIAEHRNDDEIALLEIRRLITSQLALKEEARALFTEKQLNLIEPYTGKLALKPEALGLIRESRKEIQAKSRRVRRRNLLIGAVLALAAVVSIIFAVDANRSAKAAEENKLTAENSAKEASENAEMARLSAIEAKETAAEAERLRKTAVDAEEKAKDALIKAEESKNRALSAQKKADEAKARADTLAQKILTGQIETRQMTLNAIYAIRLLEDETQHNHSEQSDTLRKLIGEIRDYASKIEILEKYQDPFYGWGYKDAMGNVAIFPRYEKAEAFNGDVARVQLGAVEAQIDKKGNLQKVITNYWKWIPVKPGQPIPDNGLLGGYQVAGKDTINYEICRAIHEDDSSKTKHSGKLTGNTCSFSWGGKEIQTQEFEILTLSENVKTAWIKESQLQARIGAGWKRVIGGWNSNETGDWLYVVRSTLGQDLVPGKLYRDDFGRPLAHLPYKGEEKTSREFEYLMVITQ